PALVSPASGATHATGDRQRRAVRARRVFDECPSGADEAARRLHPPAEHAAAQGENPARAGQGCRPDRRGPTPVISERPDRYCRDAGGSVVELIVAAVRDHAMLAVPARVVELATRFQLARTRATPARTDRSRWARYRP